MMKCIILLIMVVTTSVLVGCGPEKDQLNVSNKILFLDKGLNKDINVVRQVSDRIEGGLLRIRTQFRNREKDDLWIDIQVSWRDGQGFEMYKTNWEACHIPVGIVVDHDICSMRSDVTDYEFRMRLRQR